MSVGRTLWKQPALWAIVGLVVLVALAVAFSGEGGPSTPVQSKDTLRNELRSALESAAAAEESYRAEFGIYTDDVQQLAGGGMQVAQGIRVSVARADGISYCIEAQHPDLGETWHYDNRRGSPQPNPC